MPQVIVTEGAVRGLERCGRVLSARAPEAGRAAGQAIARQLLVFEQTPDMGHPFDDPPEPRELLIPFGDAGYIALYRYERERDAVTSWLSGTREKPAIEGTRMRTLLASPAGASLLTGV